MIHSSLATPSSCHFISFSSNLSSFLFLGCHPDRSCWSSTTHVTFRCLLLRLLLFLRLLGYRLLTLDQRSRWIMMRCQILCLSRRWLRWFDQWWYEPSFSTVRTRLAGKFKKSLFDTSQRCWCQRWCRSCWNPTVQSVQRYQLLIKQFLREDIRDVDWIHGGGCHSSCGRCDSLIKKRSFLNNRRRRRRRKIE